MAGNGRHGATPWWEAEIGSGHGVSNGKGGGAGGKSGAGSKCVQSVRCPPGTVWNPQQCQCGTKPPCPEHPCLPGTIWDPVQCKCITCKAPKAPCPAGTIWDPGKCACVPCKPPVHPCPAGTIWDPAKCSCIPCKPPAQDCPPAQYWEQGKCTCKSCSIPPDKPCEEGLAWNEKQCACVPQCPTCSLNAHCAARANCAFGVLSHLLGTYEFNGLELLAKYQQLYPNEVQARFSLRYVSINSTNPTANTKWNEAVAEGFVGACPLAAVAPPTIEAAPTFDLGLISIAFLLKIKVNSLQNVVAAEQCLWSLWQLQSIEIEQCGPGQGSFPGGLDVWSNGNFVVIDSDGTLSNIVTTPA